MRALPKAGPCSATMRTRHYQKQDHSVATTRNPLLQPLPLLAGVEFGFRTWPPLIQ